MTRRKVVKRKGLALAKPNMKITPGKALRILRELQELSQEELANLTGMKQSNISALERDVVQIGRERALALSKALKVHPSVIMFPQFDPESIGMKT